MKALVLILLTFSQYSIAATYLEKLCKDAIITIDGRSSQNLIKLYEGSSTFIFGKTRKNGNFITKLDNDEIKTLDQLDLKIHDLKESGDKLYALSNNSILVLDKLSLNELTIFKTSKDNISLKHQRASEIEIIQDKIFIAHGSLGLIVLNKKTGEMVDHNEYSLPHKKGHISRATGLAIWEDKILLAYDNVTYNYGSKKRAFEGLLVADLITLEKIKTTSINTRREALHEPSLDFVDGKLFSQNLHLIFEYDLNKLLKAKYFWPMKRRWFFDGHEIIGKPLLSNGKIRSCFKKYNSNLDTFSSRYFEVSL
ncbi:hypothetical protein A9Q84_16775 [Halobacteriovorax marinus]|uniref:Uncharacterized protein n=1 Tax=Halobacteriovorax marinus TaxID=97084 RepID=A0A1Y5F4K2_9BACT|nr:hypothetical protein A9Q84_16775 [Halobacteriovorax marinus]